MTPSSDLYLFVRGFRIENPNRHIDRRSAYLAALHHQQSREAVERDRQQQSQAAVPLADRNRRNSGDLAAAAAMVSMNGRSQPHLTGEMIRQMRQQQSKLVGVGKEPPISPAAVQFQQRVMAVAAHQTATIAALQQHNLQMQAAYERALKVRKSN